MYRLIHGDCLKEMGKLISEGVKVDMILTDPPYGTTKCAFDIVIPFEPMWERIWKIVKPNGAVCLFGNEPFSSLLRCSNLKDFKYDWVWDKVKGTGYLNAKKQPMRCHEIVSVFYHRQSQYNAQMTKWHKRKVSTAKHKRNCVKTENYGEHGLTTYDSTQRYPRSIQIFSMDTQKSKLHPQQKPVAWLEYLIRTYTNEGDTVLDFTMGSASTGIACLNTNRNFIGIEKEKKFYDISVARMDEANRCRQTSLFDG